jgi:hypothetical protein
LGDHVVEDGGLVAGKEEENARNSNSLVLTLVIVITVDCVNKECLLVQKNDLIHGRQVFSSLTVKNE